MGKRTPVFGDKNINDTLLLQHLDDTQIQALETRKTNKKHVKK